MSVRDNGRNSLTAERKPPTAMQSREPKSIRFTPEEWETIATAARARFLEPAVFVRALTMYALSIVQAPTFGEAAVGNPLQMLAGAPRTRRF